MRWIYVPTPAGRIEELSRTLGVSPILCELLLKGGIERPELASPFLAPRLAHLADPFRLHRMAEGVDRLRRAIEERQSVVVLGDYDVDGVSSTALLVGILRRFGLIPRFVVPRRLEEGYGLSRGAVDRALEQGIPSLFIALDCGTNSHREIGYLIEQGIDVMVIDHHRSTQDSHPGCTLINPHASPDGADEEERNFCTVGLVFKLVHALLKVLRAEGDPVAVSIVLKDYLDLVALGTVADLVPLLGENRIFARHGLQALRCTRRPGLRALMEVAGIRLEHPLQPVDISFRLGPRINASGRLADAALSVELMLSEDAEFCRQAARQLDEFNRERQEIEREITEQAERMVEKEYGASCGLVLYDAAWHPGVVGIVASRITRKYNRPCVVLGSEGEMAKGSGRSIFGLNLVEVLSECDPCLDHWGGHPMAVGVALAAGQVDGFRERFDKAIASRVDAANCEPTLTLTSWLPLEMIHDGLLEELEILHPYGQGNPEPVFGVRGARLRQPPDVFKEHHFRFQMDGSGGRRLFGVAWKQARRLPPSGQPIDLAVQLMWNYFNGRRLLQLELLDWRPAG